MVKCTSNAACGEGALAYLQPLCSASVLLGELAGAVMNDAPASHGNGSHMWAITSGSKTRVWGSGAALEPCSQDSRVAAVDSMSAWGRAECLPATAAKAPSTTAGRR